MVDLGKLTQEFPPSAIRQRQGGGGRSLDYLEGHAVIHRLISATENNYTLEILRIWQDADLMLAHVRLRLPGLGSREHIGVQRITANGGEDLVKGCVTDALKKAATLFGVGLELYGPDYEAGEVRQPAQRPAPMPVQAPRTSPPPAHDADPSSATDKQLKAIFVFGQQAGLDAEGIKAECAAKFLRRPRDLTRAQASEFIDYLKSMRVPD